MHAHVTEIGSQRCLEASAEPLGERIAGSACRPRDECVGAGVRARGSTRPGDAALEVATEQRLDRRRGAIGPVHGRCLGSVVAIRRRALHGGARRGSAQLLGQRSLARLRCARRSAWFVADLRPRLRTRILGHGTPRLSSVSHVDASRNCGAGASKSHRARWLRLRHLHGASSAGAMDGRDRELQSHGCFFAMAEDSDGPRELANRTCHVAVPRALFASPSAGARHARCRAVGARAREKSSRRNPERGRWGALATVLEQARLVPRFAISRHVGCIRLRG